MKIRTDFVTNSSSSNFSVVVMVEDKQGNDYSFYDNPCDYTSDDSGSAYFTGSLRKALAGFYDSDLVEALSCDFEIDVNQGKEKIQAAEELHVGARLNLKERRYSQHDGYSYSYLEIEVFRKKDSLGKIDIFGGGSETIHRALKSEKYEMSGIVTRVVPLSQRNGNASEPLINVRIIAEKIEPEESTKDDRLLSFDTVKELCEFLMESVEDDHMDLDYDEDDYDEDDYDEDDEYLMHNQELKWSKEEFIKKVTSKVKNISDIKSISVKRDYSAWGEFADLIADNDEQLCEYARRVMQSSGEERKKIMEEMTEYIHTPNSSREGESFGKGFTINYEWDDNEESLLKLCERLTSNYGPGSVSGIEYEEVNAETGEYKAYANFVLE